MSKPMSVEQGADSQQRMVSCPFCEGKKTVTYGEPGTKEVDGQKWPTIRHITSVCRECMGHGEVTFMQARVIAHKMNEAQVEYMARMLKGS